MRTAIKNKIIGCLKGKTIVGENVFFMRKGATPSPSISLFFDDEKASLYTVSPKTTKRTLTFSIEGLLTGEIPKIERFFDVVITQIETRMNTIEDFDLVYNGVRFDLDTSASVPAGIFAMDYTVSYIADEKVEIDSTELKQFYILETTNE